MGMKSGLLIGCNKKTVKWEIFRADYVIRGGYFKHILLGFIRRNHLNRTIGYDLRSIVQNRTIYQMACEVLQDLTNTLNRLLKIISCNSPLMEKAKGNTSGETKILICTSKSSPGN